MQPETSVPSGPSLEINLSDVEKIAAELDAQAKANAGTKLGGRTPRKKKAPKTGTAENPEVIPAGEEAEPAPVVDPEFEAMLTHGVSQGIDLMRDSMNLMEPGDTLRENVGKCVARLVSRLKPMESGPLADVVTATGYLAVWVLCGRQPKPAEEPSPNN